MHFQDYESEPVDLKTILKSFQIGRQRIARQVLQAWDTRFASIEEDLILDKRQAMLQIRLIENSSQYWADLLRRDANQSTPSDFPNGTRYSFFKDADGTHTTMATATKGRLTAAVSLSAQPGVKIDPARVELILKHVLITQLDRLPLLSDLKDTDVSYDDMRAGLIILQSLAVPVAVVVYGLASYMRDFGSLEALAARLEFSAASRQECEVIDLTDRTRELRRRGRRRGAITTVAIAILSIALMFLQIVTKLPSILVLPIGFMLLALLYGLYLSRRGHAVGPIPSSLNATGPAMLGMLGAFVVVSLVTYFLLASVALLIVYDFGSIPIKILLVAVAAVIGMWLLRFTASPLRIAKRRAQPNVCRALAEDPRQEVMLLRSFQDDDLMMRMHRSARHSAIELASAQTFERFEELLAWLLWRFGPVVAFGQPGTHSRLQPLGAAREFHDDATWQASAKARMVSASLIVFVVGRSASLAWEVQAARSQGLLGKCLFVVPPVELGEAARRLLVLANALELDPAAIPAEMGRRTIGIYFDQVGAPVVLGVDGRDDFAYEVLCERTLPTLIRRPRGLDSVAASVRASPRDMNPYVVTFHPGWKYNRPPKIRDGLRLFLGSVWKRAKSSGYRRPRQVGSPLLP
ncbi:hypothetical protein A5640_09575 [Mycobacterium asiaticum]|uniref:Uncharacterized protein n=2 Tax=Mycobacterium asiaticum TaxID=1790 RepID=A0A1A3KNL3_MYCAS|nr:hypothetical protein A5640_09575 [Mycobacterium asiaticum]